MLNLLMMLPAWWRDGQWFSVLIIPEAWLLVALFALLPARTSTRLAAWIIAALFALVVIATFFDGLLRQVLSRELNVLLDPLMLEAGFHLIDGSLGRWAAILASILLALLCVLLVLFVRKALKPGQSSHPMIMTVVIVAAVITLTAWFNVFAGIRIAPVATQLVVAQTEQVRQTLQSQREFQRALASQQMDARPIQRLAGRDVYLVFIESYGVSLIDQDRYRKYLLPLLEQSELDLRDAGLATRSTRLEAPIRGGQSWLAHATVLTGQHIDNQYAYRLFIDSDADTLADDFRATGHAGMKVSPAIIMDWPEGNQLGFDQVFAAADLDYHGPPLGWVTMPDQYTLHYFSEHIRPRYEQPVFAQIALISSHAPWTPVIEPVDWSRIEDGRIFDRWRNIGANPLRLWTQPERLREAYRKSIEYALAVTLDWARHALPEDALLIVIGDHQAASPVTGRGVSADVPVHLISGDRKLLNQFAGSGFEIGMVPADDQSAGTMADLRAMFRRL
jgi:hypothetical protein